MTALDLTLVASRLVQFAAAAGLGGGALFCLYGGPPQRPAWKAFVLSASLGAVATLAWLMAQAGQLGDTAADAFAPGKVLDVATGTGFGRVALVRGVLFAVGALTAAALSGRARRVASALIGLAASASFAWTGHGNIDEGWAGLVHLAADVAHLLAATVWIGALFALSGLLVGLARRAAPTDAGAAAAALNSFSRIGVAVVAVIVASGLVNGWFLVGPGGLASLLTTIYGQLLVAKLLLFLLMLALAAANRYRHTPSLEAGPAGEADALRSATRSVAVETGAAVAVLTLVAWLGTLAPPIHG